jgi:hypothetical protein
MTQLPLPTPDKAPTLNDTLRRLAWTKGERFSPSSPKFAIRDQDGALVGHYTADELWGILRRRGLL